MLKFHHYKDTLCLAYKTSSLFCSFKRNSVMRFGVRPPWPPPNCWSNKRLIDFYRSAQCVQSLEVEAFIVYFTCLMSLSSYQPLLFFLLLLSFIASLFCLFLPRVNKKCKENPDKSSPAAHWSETGRNLHIDIKLETTKLVWSLLMERHWQIISLLDIGFKVSSFHVQTL